MRSHFKKVRLGLRSRLIVLMILDLRRVAKELPRADAIVSFQLG